MAKGIKTGGRDFVKGQSGNPLGAAAHNPVVKAIRRLTNDDIADVGALILEGNQSGLKAIAENPETPVLRLWIAKAALRAIEKGDDHTLMALLDRFAGKVKDTSEVKQDITIHVRDYTSKKAVE